MKRMAALAFALLMLAGCGSTQEVKEDSPTATPTATPLQEEYEGDANPAPSIDPADEPQVEITPAPEVTPEIVFDWAALESMENKDDYMAAWEMNEDTVAYLTVPNTSIEYPVMLTTDNDYYLSHDVEKQESKSGAIFFDYRTNETLTTAHLIIYGHNMKAGTMFHDLNSYKYKDFFDNNRTITLYVGSQKREYEVYAAYIAPPDVYFIRMGFADGEDFITYMEELRALSKFPTDTVISQTDQILTLSTCTYEVDDARFVVQAKLVSVE